jgi:hypothetical protein
MEFCVYFSIMGVWLGHLLPSSHLGSKVTCQDSLFLSLSLFSSLIGRYHPLSLNWIKFEIDINNDGILETIWKHKKKVKIVDQHFTLLVHHRAQIGRYLPPFFQLNFFIGKKKKEFGTWSPWFYAWAFWCLFNLSSSGTHPYTRKLLTSWKLLSSNQVSSPISAHKKWKKDAKFVFKPSKCDEVQRNATQPIFLKTSFGKRTISNYPIK